MIGAYINQFQFNICCIGAKIAVMSNVNEIGDALISIKKSELLYSSPQTQGTWN